MQEGIGINMNILNSLMGVIIWIALLGGGAWYFVEYYIKSPQNLQEFIEYYKNIEWDINYDYDSVLEGLEEYIRSNTYEKGQIVSTKNFFIDEDHNSISAKYVNKATLDLIAKLRDKNGYECLLFQGESNGAGEVSNNFYRRKSLMYNVAFTERYYESMSKKSSYNQTIVNSNIGVLAQGEGDNNFEGNINISTHSDKELEKYIKEHIENINDKRERRVLEDILDILRSGSYPSEDEIGEISSDIKKRPVALQILKQAALSFSGQLSSEASKWFIAWIDSFSVGG